MKPATWSDETRDALTLACVSGVGPVAFRRSLATYGSASAALAALDAGAWTSGGDPQHAADKAQRLAAECERRGVGIVALTDPRYPTTLHALEDAPSMLFALGDLAAADAPAVAIVGSRRATPYGRRVAHRFAVALADAGVCVVSGLAAGIDAEAHEGALQGNGATIAVLGTGVDVPYPANHAALHTRIAGAGLILSELPPGRRAHPGAFPRRNRLIAALADVVLVVEAGYTSGALITAQLGFDLGRVVAAVPGSIESSASMGTNQLLRDGAHVVASSDDLLSLLALTPRGRNRPRGRTATTVALEDGPDAPDLAGAPDGGTGALVPGRRQYVHTPVEKQLLSILSMGPRFPDELVRATTLSPREVSLAISTLAIDGQVAVDAAGWVHRTGVRTGVRSGAP